MKVFGMQNALICLYNVLAETQEFLSIMNVLAELNRNVYHQITTCEIRQNYNYFPFVLYLN